MKDYKELIDKIEQSGEELFWQGGADNDQIKILEEKLKVKLPISFKNFLNEYGGGGVIDDEISGIESNNAELKTGGTILRDTLECRENFDLPNHLVVVFYKYQELAWCIDCSSRNNENECPIVSYDLFRRKVTNVIADNFELFFKQYLELRAGIDL
ncbi:SMI1-KNR4 cell-wall [Zobellia uliginosa]|uniref:SMI1-KNR4 cell-wall n=1 Tax=Zobellia uliginosa TaxID=143224 RepID=A0ABY1L3W2_9FLAO|nr:SMI1/KNR4 family protein [Zobellia uliginosa]SIS97414.1 SMI1-KNR4 cell-wall [Zobellia uliginosa]